MVGRKEKVKQNNKQNTYNLKTSASYCKCKVIPTHTHSQMEHLEIRHVLNFRGLVYKFMEYQSYVIEHSVTQ